MAGNLRNEPNSRNFSDRCLVWQPIIPTRRRRGRARRGTTTGAGERNLTYQLAPRSDRPYPPRAFDRAPRRGVRTETRGAHSFYNVFIGPDILSSSANKRGKNRAHLEERRAHAGKRMSHWHDSLCATLGKRLRSRSRNLSSVRGLISPRRKRVINFLKNFFNWEKWRLKFPVPIISSNSDRICR